jgi:D-lyxose ketol-isomerase
MTIRYPDIELAGEERASVLARCEAQLRHWGLTPPPVIPLVIDFLHGQFHDTGLIEYWVANEEVIGYCGKLLLLFEGQTCPEHRHRRKHETFFVMRGSVTMCCNGALQRLEQGALLAMPPGTAHWFQAVEGPALLLEVSSPSIRGDNTFTDKRVGQEGIL